MMGEIGSEESIPNLSDQTAALQKCISLFKSAKNDNERFASLLLVTRLVQSHEVDGSQRRLLFDAIGFTFINRLLNTRSVPEECSGGVYQSLAVAMLACFATDEELLFHQEMVGKIHVLNQIVSSAPQDDKDGIDDAYQILTHFSSSVNGCKFLLEGNTVSILCGVISQDSYKPDIAWKIVLNMATLMPGEMWTNCPRALIQLTSHAANKLRTLQDMNKFDLCANMVSLLSHVGTNTFKDALKYVENENLLFSDLSAGLRDILQGKVTSHQRDPAIILISFVTDLLANDIKWVFSRETATRNEKEAEFFVLIVTSVSIEIRMILDESVNTTDELIQKSTLLTSCYNIMENVIAYLITMADTAEEGQIPAEQECNLERGMVSKLYSQVTEAMMAVLMFLQQKAVEYESGVIELQEDDLVIASARVLCAWLAEESMALQKEVNKVLPFLISLAKNSMNSNQVAVVKPKGDSMVKAVTFQEPMETNMALECHQVELLRFMLPALCHLSAHEKSRKILVENHTHDMLVEFYSNLWQRCLQESFKHTDTTTALVTLLGVLLNFAVTEPDLIKMDPSFLELQSHIAVNLPKMSSSENVNIVAHLVVLGLMLTRHQKKSNDCCSKEFLPFFKSVILFLKEANSVLLPPTSPTPLHVACQSDWKTISELWFLGVQVLTACVQQFGGLDDLVRESGWIDEIQVGLNTKQGMAEGEEKDSLDTLLGLHNAVMKKR